MSSVETPDERFRVYFPNSSNRGAVLLCKLLMSYRRDCYVWTCFRAKKTDGCRVFSTCPFRALYRGGDLPNGDQL